MTASPETREAVARAIFCTSRPGHVWDHQPPAVVDYWSTLADAAIGAINPPQAKPSPVEGLAQALGLPQVVEDILNQFPLDSTGHVQDCGYDSTEGHCACSTLPRRLSQVLA